MDVYDIRQAHTQKLIERFDTQDAFAEFVGIPPSYVSRMLSHGKNRKRIGEDYARKIETVFKLPRYALDKASGEDMEHQTFHGVSISIDEARLGQEWGKLQEPIKSQVQSMIETMVSSQMRHARAAKKPEKVDKADKRPRPL